MIVTEEVSSSTSDTKSLDDMIREVIVNNGITRGSLIDIKYTVYSFNSEDTSYEHAVEEVSTALIIWDDGQPLEGT